MTISAMKLDCEGCEYAAFRDLYCMDERAQPAIFSLSVEFHFRVEQRMVTAADVERIRYVGLFLHRHSYASFQFDRHMGILVNYRGGPAYVHPELVAAGVDWINCCYLHGFVREELERGE